MARIRITYELSPWKNGARVSRKTWRRVGAWEIPAASVQMVPETRVVLWAVYPPDKTQATSRGEVPYGDNKTLARINAKRAADEALRKMAEGSGP